MKNLYKKLLSVQQVMKAIEKDSVNPHFKNRYFDINTLLAELKPILSANGLIVLQPITIVEGVNTLQTHVIDAESAESITSSIALPNTEKAQELGSAMTYYRRYALTSLFALEAEDDDGEVATKATLVPTAEPKKVCPTCGKEHGGKYAKCVTCYYKKGADNIASG